MMLTSLHRVEKIDEFNRLKHFIYVLSAYRAETRRAAKAHSLF